MDKIFKIGLLILGFSYLAYLFCPIAFQSGRYDFHKFNNNMIVMDTATADLYVYYKDLKLWIKLNPTTSGMPSVTKVKMPREVDKTMRSDYQEYLGHLRLEQIKERLGFEKDKDEEQTKREAIEKGYTEDWKTRTK